MRLASGDRVWWALAIVAWLCVLVLVVMFWR